MVELFLWYSFFSLVTSLSICLRTAHIIKSTTVQLSIGAWASYLGVTFLVTFLLSPIFFVVFIFFSEEHKRAIVQNLLEE